MGPAIDIFGLARWLEQLILEASDDGPSQARRPMQLGAKPRRWTDASVQREPNRARPDQVVAELAPPWTSRTSGPLPWRITVIGCTARGSPAVSAIRVAATGCARRVGHARRGPVAPGRA